MPCRKIPHLTAIVGENIVYRRKRIGMTQEALAERLKISAAALSRIENGLAAPRFSRLEELANILDCPVADLFRQQSEVLKGKLDAIEDLLRALPATIQDDVIVLMLHTIKTVKKILYPRS